MGGVETLYACKYIYMYMCVCVYVYECMRECDSPTEGRKQLYMNT